MRGRAPDRGRMDGNRHETSSDPTSVIDDGGGVGNDPLLPGERDVYGTDHTAGDGSEDALPSAGTDARVWFVVGLVLLVVFLGILVWAVVQPLM